MAFTCVDSASINSIVHFFNENDISSLDSWTTNTAREMTTNILINKSLTRILSPELKSPSFGKYGNLHRHLSSYIFETSDLQPFHSISIRNTLSWLSRRKIHIRDEFNHFINHPTCIKWLEQDKSRIWEHHSQTRRGLFNKTFLNSIAQVLDVPENNLNELYHLSCNIDEVRKYLSNNTLSSEFATIEKAYLLSAIIRGIYQDYLVRISNNVVLQHPLRRNENFYPKVVKDKKISYPLPNTASILADIILMSSHLENKETRVEVYTSYISKARKAIFAEEIDISPKYTINAARDCAINASKKIGIHSRNKTFYNSIDIFLSLGLGTISSFVLSPYIGFILSGTSYILTKKYSTQKRIGTYFDNESQYIKLLNDIPGRLNTSWDS